MDERKKEKKSLADNEADTLMSRQIRDVNQCFNCNAGADIDAQENAPDDQQTL